MLSLNCPPAPGSPDDPNAFGQRALISRSRLFDAAYYITHPPLEDPEQDPLAHFIIVGWREGRRPNPYFDTAWYLRQNPDVARADINPLVDYILRGEKAGCAPCACFDVLWYRARHPEIEAPSLLADFLERRSGGAVSPIPEFDPVFYLAAYPDVASVGCDPFEHYLHWGFREGRNPSADFDTRFFVRRYLDGDFSVNPLVHYRQFRHAMRLHATPPAHERGVFDEVRRFTRPGPDFERFAPLPRHAPRRAKLLAYYLPQFHAIPENDAWWGDGFTEWTFLARGQPRFAGHYQPRTPRDLGCYSLDDPRAIRRQIEMARDAGVFGFVFYFYWFNGHRLLERPLEMLLADRSLDFPFCLMWTNENWSRRWDGSESDVLISQDYAEADDEALIDAFARHFADPRYIRIGKRPVLMIYRPALIPDSAETMARWRRLFLERHGERPLIVMAQSFKDSDPRPHGLDGAIEFPPHKLVEGLPLRNVEMTPFDSAAEMQVFSYDDVVAASLGETATEFPLIKTVVPGWDNDARRQGAGLVMQGATPAKYQAWLSELVERASGAGKFHGEAIVCVNAWNEWAEGAYLEPDVHFGAAFANATGRAVARMQPAAQAGLILLVGHDAFPAGAQMLLLNLGRLLMRRFGMKVEFLLLAGGDLLVEYEALAPTRIAGDAAAACAEAAGRGVAAAIVNTSAAARVCEAAAASGIRATLLIHEMARIIDERGLAAPASAGCAAAATIVFPARCVADSAAPLLNAAAERTVIMPQGCYRPVERDPEQRNEIRKFLGLAAGQWLVLGAGTGDFRKGVDLFLHLHRALRRRLGERVACCWIGRIDPEMKIWLGAEMDAAEGFFAPGFQAHAENWFSAADAFALTSREDPFPTVVMEAMSAGIPVAAFAGGGGAPELIERLRGGRVAAMGDTEAMADAIDAMLAERKPADAARLAEAIRRDCDFADYAARLMALARPAPPSISVVVTSCDYERHMAARLGSIFAQTFPVREVIVLDDASIDGSVAAAEDIARDWRRDVAILRTPVRTGSAFGNWRRAAETARGDWLWIAEADDEAEPSFLARAAEMILGSPDLLLVASDARAIDADGAPLWPDHRGYFSEAEAGALHESFVAPADDFCRRYLTQRNLLLNVSGVLWRRDALVAALERCGDDLACFRLAGDWRVYVEILANAAGSVAWIASPLNVHRRHAASVTGAIDARRQIKEIRAMHSLLTTRLRLGSGEVARLDSYLDELAWKLGVGPPPKGTSPIACAPIAAREEMPPAGAAKSEAEKPAAHAAINRPRRATVVRSGANISRSRDRS